MFEKDEVNRKFPDMKPIKSVPSMQTINGVGTSLYGARDRDIETGTYVKTHVFVLLFIPILSLGAYRVADAPGGGWYFVGKVPLSPFAAMWNWITTACIVICAGSLVTAIAWENYTSSSGYIAKERLKEAQVQVQRDKPGLE